ncbi:unnamed protein product, partial [Rotaria sordida]
SFMSRSLIAVPNRSSVQTTVQKAIYLTIDYTATLAERGPTVPNECHRKNGEQHHSDRSNSSRNNHRIRWTEIYSQLFEEKRKNPELRLVYADFTYSTYELKKMTIGIFSDMEANQNTSNSQSSENDTKIKSLSSLARSSSSTNEFINILLLGESGVGKSTFINAFANYLHFQTLGDAEKSEPIVIIPVSFLLTINDNFDEKIIKFGHIDSNENHNNSGQSVTQQCKSYVFDISNEKKLRIIDTPGFGDTRGIDQDDVNMEGIFSFLHNINYLNGICLLFKPEVVQLNLYWQSCLIQLFDYFGENIVNNFIFCFTNARSTFFTLGNTRPLLKKLFESFPRKNIPFEKNNTFCFDSEAFRYLVAIRDSIKFDPNERHDFEQSWIRSTIESERFRDFLCHLYEYRKNYEWQSIKDVQFQINFMIRPILETMRNLHRNIILYNLNLSIELSATYEISSSMICYTCNRNPEKFNDFWILPDHLHNSLNMCTSNEPKSIEYRLNYQAVDHQVNESLDNLNKYLDVLCETSARFAQFLIKNSQTQ